MRGDCAHIRDFTKPRVEGRVEITSKANRVWRGSACFASLCRLGARVVIALAVLTVAHAQAAPGRATSVRVQGRSDVVVTEPTVRLGDIAQIDSTSVIDDELIVKLRTILVARSPQVGDSTVIEGLHVLERLKGEGIPLDSLLYTFPRQIKVTRAFREVSADELSKALQSFLVSQDRKIDVRQLMADKPVKIPTDSFGVEVVALQAVKPGHFGVDYRSIAGSDEVRFQLRAIADEWRLMPVATKPLKKGEVVKAEDVKLERINGTAAGRDSIEQIGDLVGRSLVKDVGQGEMFRAGAVVVPPVIASGSRVTMIYRQGRLQATAIGTALETGAEGQEIKVRNESSGKVIEARVVEKGIVEVGAK